MVGSMAFTPQKLVHQQALVEVFGEGLYTELDFRNEAGRLQTLGGHVGSRFSLELLHHTSCSRSRFEAARISVLTLSRGSRLFAYSVC